MIYCPNDGKIIKQKPKTKRKFFCDRKCYNSYKHKIGYFKKAMQIYFLKHPEAREKANDIAKVWNKEHPKNKTMKKIRICVRRILR